MNLTELAKSVSDNPETLTPVTAPKAGKPVEPVESESKSAQMLAELEEKHGFDRSEPSMEYQGSQNNADWVKKHIEERWGEQAAEEYRPCIQVKPKTEWLKLGYIAKNDEKPLCKVVTRRKGSYRDIDMWHQNQMIEG